MCEEHDECSEVAHSVWIHGDSELPAVDSLVYNSLVFWLLLDTAFVLLLGVLSAVAPSEA